MITPEQRELRRKYIGSSDAAAIMGLDPYRSPADVWLEKTGATTDFAGNANTERGTLLEPVILTWAEQDLSDSLDRPVKLARDIMVTSDCGMLAANLDGICYQDGFIVEAKSSVNADVWGEVGTDIIPDRVIVQTQHAMFVAGISMRVAYVPVLLPGYRSFDFRMYRVDRNDELIEQIVRRERDFMVNHVRAGERPGDYKPSLDVLKRVRREPNKTVPIDPRLIVTLALAREDKRAAEKKCEEAEAAAIAALGDAECGEYVGGKVTYMQSSRKGYTVEPTTFRSLRIKQNKDAAARRLAEPVSA